MSTPDPTPSPARTVEEAREQIEETREELAETVEQLAAKADVKARAADKLQNVREATPDPGGLRRRIAGDPARAGIVAAVAAGVVVGVRRRRR
ncbi:DUF3618 domain-containing protein [Paraconexibacter algicola]|uniref:DUF3618 domain-containing protein n=1 Tax=Paraconexibacter algicola TaxID=2133960 RepID=A0A2T4UL60_9ACTN|nr:DUF3618 domain-containing protein [Paraconexibacter algicola]PTL59982.1 hypothetical protein C7Y72_10155 [Paraconexibacter algicola]